MFCLGSNSFPTAATKKKCSSPDDLPLGLLLIQIVLQWAVLCQRQFRFLPVYIWDSFLEMGKRICHFARCCHVPRTEVIPFCTLPRNVWVRLSLEASQEKLLSNCGIYIHLLGEKWSLSVVWICISNWCLSFPPATAHPKFRSTSTSPSAGLAAGQGNDLDLCPWGLWALGGLGLSDHGCFSHPRSATAGHRSNKRHPRECPQLQTCSFLSHSVSATLPLYENQRWLYPATMANPFGLLNHGHGIRKWPGGACNFRFKGNFQGPLVEEPLPGNRDFFPV